MTRFALGLLLVSGVAFAETQADIANRENEEGKQLMFAQKYADASAKFRDAAARSGGEEEAARMTREMPLAIGAGA